MKTNACVITYSCSDIHKELQDEFHTLHEHLFSDQIKWSRNDVENFAQNNKNIFKYKKYCGYFLWKPYIILQTLKLYDRVLYVDSNLRVTDNRLITLVNEHLDNYGIFIPKYRHYFNSQWTKKDTFILMGADESHYWNANQIWSSIMGFTRDHIDLLEEYLRYCSIEDCITETPNKLGNNSPSFIEHRWEQSIMSILVEKYNIPTADQIEVSRYCHKEYPPELIEQKSKEGALDVIV